MSSFSTLTSHFYTISLIKKPKKNCLGFLTTDDSEILDPIPAIVSKSYSFKTVFSSKIPTVIHSQYC